MSCNAEEQLLAARAQILQLQAADLPSALRGLLEQATSQLKPPRAGAPAAAAAAASAASRPALVLGLLLVLERASAVAQQQHDLKLVKDAHTQLSAAFQQHDWLWQLLLRKHLAYVLQHPAAAQRLLGALATLPASTQARAYRLWVQQLAAQPAALAVPLKLQLALLEQLRQCFTVRSLDLGLPSGSEPLGQAVQQGSAAGDAAATAGVSGEGLPGAEVHVALREQLPSLLQLLLRVTCSSTEAAARATAAAQPGEGNNSGRGSASAPQAPSLSTVQSAVAARRDPRRRGSSGAAASQAARAASAEASSGAAGAPSNSSARCSVLESVLQHAVLLIGRLSDPDALHEMLGIQLRQTAQLPTHGSGSEGDEQWEEGEGQQERQQGAAAAERQRLLSRCDAERISTAAALIEVCLDGMLSLPPLAAAVHQQLHSKGNSNAAAVGGAEPGEAAAEAGQELQDAAAELRTTAGLMLGMHRELSRLLAERRQQLQGRMPTSAAAATLRQPAPLLSLPACQQLLCMLADVAAVPGGAASGPSGSGQQQKSGSARPQLWTAAERPPAVLLVPPQLAVQGIELVRRAVEADTPSFQPAAAAAEAPSWRVAMAAQVAAIYSACYQAIWGAKVLQSAEAYQLLLAAARLRRLLRPADGTAAAPGAADDEAAAEAALLAENAVGNRRRRQRSAAHELPTLGAVPKGAEAAGGALPAAKRLKTQHGSNPSSMGGDGSAVAELLQLFSSPAVKQPASGSEPGQQQRAAGRKRIIPVAVSQQEQQPEQQQQQQQGAVQPHAQEQQRGKPARKRIVPQQIGPAPNSSKPASAGAQPSQQGSGALAAAAGAEQQGEGAEEGQGEAFQPGWQQGQRRIIISKAADMTEEQQEEMWAAYIADKEFLAEMLGDADYQRWFDEAAHPLRKQRQRPGGLEAAWAAVLGGRSAGSIVQQQLPRTLLEASVTMRWDAAAAACLGLLGALLRGAAASPSSAADDEAAAEPAGRQPSELEQLLQGAFSQQQREVGARAATRILGFTGSTSITGTMQAAQKSPAGAWLVLLSAQMLGLAQGQNYFQQTAVSGLAYQGVPAEQQRAADSGGVVAPPLLEAYAQLLVALLPRAQQEATAASAATPGTARLAHLTRMCHPLSVTAQLAERLLRLPPPLQHMLGPGCAALLRVAAAGRDSDAQQAAQQHAALLWMLVQPRQAYTAGADGGVQLPADCPSWLQEEALLLERSCPSFQQHRSDGHAMLLGPAPEVQRAAALELLQQLRLQLEVLRQQGGSLPTDVLVAAADACHATMQRLLLESQAQRRRQQADAGGSDGDSEGEEEQQGGPLLLGSRAAAEVAALAAALCDLGAAAAASIAAALDAAAASGGQASQQPRQRRPQQQQVQHEEQAQQQPDSQACMAAAEAARVLVLCNQLLEPADQLLQSGCLVPAAQLQLEAACELLDGQGQAVGQLSDGLPQGHPLTAAIEAAMAEATALWQPAAEEEREQPGTEAEASSGSDGSGGEESAPSLPAGRQRSKAGSGTAGGSGKASSGKAQSAGKPKGRHERRRQRRRKMGEVRNPAVRAMLAEDGGAGLDDDDLSDLEDFLVFNPERDYDTFFKRHFWQARGNDSEEEQEAKTDGPEEVGGEDEPAAQQQGAGTSSREEARQAAQRNQPKQQRRQRERQRPLPAKQRNRVAATAKQQQQQQQAEVDERHPALGSVAAAAAAAGAAAAAKRQSGAGMQAGGKAQTKRS